MSLLVEQNRVQDLIFMKYRFQTYDLERTVQEMKISDDEDIKTLKETNRLAIAKFEQEIEDKYALAGEEKVMLNNIVQKIGKITSGGNDGINLTFEDYKKVIKTIVKLSE